MHESKSRLDSVSREVAPQRSVGRPRHRGRPADRPPALALTGSLNAARSLWPHLAASSHCNNSRRQKWVNAFALLASPFPALFPSSNEFLAFALARPLKISSTERTSLIHSVSPILFTVPLSKSLMTVVKLGTTSYVAFGGGGGKNSSLFWTVSCGHTVH